MLKCSITKQSSYYLYYYKAIILCDIFVSFLSCGDKKHANIYIYTPLNETIDLLNGIKPVSHQW